MNTDAPTLPRTISRSLPVRLAHKLLIASAAAVAFVVSFASTSAAASAAGAADADPLDLLRPLLDAFAHGRYLYAGSVALVIACALARRYGGARFPQLHTNEGATALVFVGSIAATLSARLADPDAVFAWPMLWDAFCVGAGAIGGYAGFKMFIAPLLQKALARWPRAAGPLKALAWMFDHPSDPKNQPADPPLALVPPAE